MKHIVTSIGACGLSAVLFWYGSGLEPLWWCAWIAPLPVLLWATRVKAATAFALALTASFVGALNEWHYLHTLIGIPAFAAVAITGLPALVFASATSTWRWLVLRGAPIRASIAMPAVMVACYFAQQRWSIHSTFGNPGYSQMDFLSILQLAAITGIAGITFAQFFLPAAIAAAVTGTHSARHRVVTALVAIAAVAVVCIWGQWRLKESPGQLLQVGLIAADPDNNPQLRGPAAKATLVSLYSQQATALIERGAKLVVLPEKIMQLSDEELATLEPPLQLAASKGAFVVFGVERWGQRGKFNEARVYAPAGGRVSTYEKHHMLPPFESPLTIGTERVLFEQSTGKWGMQICKDMDFPQLSREYGNDGVGLMIVPAWDFDVDGWLHGRMAIMRGVESGFSVARAPNDGRLTLSDSRGRVLADVVTQNSAVAVVLASIPVHHEATLYSRWGDWFSWLAIGLLAGSTISVMAKRSKH